MNAAAIQKHFGTYADIVTPAIQNGELAPVLAELKNLADQGKKILPDKPNIFRALHETPLDKVRVVIIGQDPYPNEAHASGLAFAIPGTNTGKVPASLQVMVDTIEKQVYDGLNLDKNIFDVTLKHWTDQGILLLNSSLTVATGEDGKFVPGGHQLMWRPFMHSFLKRLQMAKKRLIFLGMGAASHELCNDMDIWLHYPLMVEHPASAAREKRQWNNNFCFNWINSVITSNPDLGAPIEWFNK